MNKSDSENKTNPKYWRNQLKERDKQRKARLLPAKRINGKKPLDHAMDEISRKMKEKKDVKKGHKKDIVEDVLDSNYEAEVDPDAVPTGKAGVLWKKDDKKNSLNKLKSFVKDRKK